MKEHIQTVMNHFKGDVYVWDVCNEALKNTVSASQLNNGDIWRTGASESVSGDGTLDWYKLCGTDYIKEAFKTADSVRTSLGLTADDMKLYYNDYNLNDPNKSAACVQLVKMLQQEGIAIDGVGMQAHYRLSGYAADKTKWLNNFENAIKEYTKLGIDVQITELDIRVYAKDSDTEIYDGKLSEETEALQAEMYGKIFEICRKYAKPWTSGAGCVTGVTTWGVADTNNAWNTDSHAEYPLMFSSEMVPKKAYYSVIDF